eukprot:5044568-Amphidinium_carterae.1
MRELAQVKLPLESAAMLEPPMVVCVNPRDPIRQGPIDGKLKLFAAEYMNHPIRSSQGRASQPLTDHALTDACVRFMHDLFGGDAVAFKDGLAKAVDNDAVLKHLGVA